MTLVAVPRQLRAAALAAMLAALAMVPGCGGSIPDHSGYKSDKAKPWKKPKLLALDKKAEALGEGELDYGDYRRAKWFAIDLPGSGKLTVELEADAPETDDEDYDIGLEMLDENFAVLARADQEEDDAGELTKSRTAFAAGGRVYIHVYLQRRTDNAAFELRARFASESAAYESDFPAQVAFLPDLPQVPLTDDTPLSEIRKKPPEPKNPKGPKRPPPTKTDEPVAETSSVSGKIIGVSVAGSDTIITINRGTSAGVADGWKGTVVGLRGGSFRVDGCSERTCTGRVKATPDEVNKYGSVSMRP